MWRYDINSRMVICKTLKIKQLREVFFGDDIARIGISFWWIGS